MDGFAAPDGVQVSALEERRLWMSRPDIVVMLPETGWLLHAHDGRWYAGHGERVQLWHADGTQTPELLGESDAPLRTPATWQLLFESLWEGEASDEVPTGCVHDRGLFRVVPRGHAALPAVVGWLQQQGLWSEPVG
jgi:hypothetical protein